MSHHLKVDPTCQSVKHKKRSFTPKCQKAISEEVDKLLKTGFIKEAIYSDWLVNVILIKKMNRKWCMYIDFIDLSRVYLKDSYSLPQIDQMMDATSGHKLLNFMDDDALQFEKCRDDLSTTGG
ncbi:uncharacterized protein [Elaeis guineensis]|uniref:uncharacterized protein n=1 Tax=Elaeis guineensis var. tenera TaxID=51953 RepID=UPI003C6D4AE5